MRSIYPDGEHTIAFNVADSGNRETTIERTFTIDNTPPAIISFTPQSGIVQSGNVSISVSVSDVSNVSGVYISIDGGPWYTMAYSREEGEAYYGWNTEASDNGVHKVSIKVADSLGNTQVYDYTIIVDNPNYAPLLFLVILAAGVALIYIGVKKSRKTEPSKSSRESEEVHQTRVRGVKNE
jgi:hypothetical protein